LQDEKSRHGRQYPRTETTTQNAYVLYFLYSTRDVGCVMAQPRHMKMKRGRVENRLVFREDDHNRGRLVFGWVCFAVVVLVVLVVVTLFKGATIRTTTATACRTNTTSTTTPPCNHLSFQHGQSYPRRMILWHLFHEDLPFLDNDIS
jgi:hypothetical protein